MNILFTSGARGDIPCSTGAWIIGDYLKQGASIRVYDESTGDLLASGTLTAAIDPDYGCAYSLDNLEVPRVDWYRTVIDGTKTIVSSVVDLKVAAVEKGVEADLFLGKYFKLTG